MLNCSMAHSSDSASRSFTPSTWRWHRQTLLRLRTKLLADQVEQLREMITEAPQGQDSLEAGTSETDHDFACALLAQEKDALVKIDAALERIRQGSYGVCVVTGLPIPAARLRAVPWAATLRDVGNRKDSLR
jgi:DnaK suppressor protein